MKRDYEGERDYEGGRERESARESEGECNWAGRERYCEGVREILQEIQRLQGGERLRGEEQDCEGRESDKV